MQVRGLDDLVKGKHGMHTCMYTCKNATRTGCQPPMVSTSLDRWWTVVGWLA